MKNTLGAGTQRGYSGTIRGVISGVMAYSLWGVFPIYFRLVHFASNLEIMVHRIVWSAVLLTLYQFLFERDLRIKNLFSSKKVLLNCFFSAGLIFVNWYLFVYAVSSGQTLAASFGYFLNPLLIVLLGTFVFKEKLRRLQWLAFAFALVGVFIELAALGKVPVLSIALAGSFALYGLAKKQAGIGPVDGLWVESVILLPVALGFACYLFWGQQFTSIADFSVNRVLLLGAAGPVTVLPLLLFARAAQSLRYSVMGFLQYIAPTGQMLVATYVFHEELVGHRLAAFAFVWLGIGVLVLSQVLELRRSSQYAHFFKQ